MNMKKISHVMLCFIKRAGIFSSEKKAPVNVNIFIPRWKLNELFKRTYWSVIWAAYIFALHFGRFVEESEKTVEWINDREVAAIFCWAVKQFGEPIFHCDVTFCCCVFINKIIRNVLPSNSVTCISLCVNDSIFYDKTHNWQLYKLHIIHMLTHSQPKNTRNAPLQNASNAMVG